MLSKKSTVRSLLICLIAVVFTVTASVGAYAATLPTSVSSLENGYVTGVKDQGKWGACWAFAATAASESSIIKEHGYLTNQTLDLSENLLTYMASYPNEYGDFTVTNDRYITNYDTDTDYLDAGGNLVLTAAKIMNWLGHFDENEDYPYSSWDVPGIAESFSKAEYEAIMAENPYKLTDFKVVCAYEDDYVERVKELINDYGAVAMSYYESGAVNNAGMIIGDYINVIGDEYYAFCYDATKSQNHGVTVVGYDDSIPASYFAKGGYRPAADGAWLVKNSWGADLFNEGYLWVSYYDVSIGELVAYDYATVYDDDYYDNLYSYDGSVPYINLSTTSCDLYSANVFTAEDDEIITSASYFSDAVGDQYSISLYVNLKDVSKPTSGTLVGTVTETAQYTGYHTVDFKDTEIKSGSSFAVVMQSHRGSGKSLIYFEMSSGSISEYVDYETGIKKGESFYSTNGTSWADYGASSYGGGNALLKAYTEDPKPQAITDLAVSQINGNRFKLSWTPASRLFRTEIVIYDENGAVVVNDTTEAGASEYTVTGLTKNTQYYIFARNTSTVSSETTYSNYADATVQTANKVTVGSAEINVDEITSTIADISWTEAENATGYAIYLSNDANFEEMLFSGQTSDTYCTLYDLSPGTTYYVAIRPYCDTGSETIYCENYNYISFTTAPEIKLTVSGFTSAEIKSDSVTLKWTECSDADGYIIEQYVNGAWTEIANISDSKTTTCCVENLQASTTYKFRMKAYGEDSASTVISEYTDELSVTTLPSVVVNFSADSVTAEEINLSWTLNDSADGYILEQYVNGAWTRIAKLSGKSVTSYAVTGFASATTHNFRIRAYNMVGSTALYSSYTTLTVEMPRGELTPVTGFALGGRASNALRLNWTKNTSADGYIIEQYISGKWTRIAKLATNETTTYRVEGLAGGTAYKFRMRAYRMTGSTAEYTAYTSVISARTNPSSVTGFALGGRASDALRLNWTKNTSADGYIVEQYTNGKWSRVAKIVGNSTVTYRVEGLAPSIAYKFRIRAYKMSGSTALYSTYSATVSSTTNPSAVKDLVIGGRASNALRLNWTKNTSADGYIVEMYKNGAWTRVTKITSPDTLTYRVSGLKSGTEYQFRIRGYNMVGSTAIYGAYSYVNGTTIG